VGIERAKQKRPAAECLVNLRHNSSSTRRGRNLRSFR
jgi:hypothetical protein